MEQTAQNTARKQLAASAMDLVAEDLLMSRFGGEVVMTGSEVTADVSPMMAGVLKAIRNDNRAA